MPPVNSLPEAPARHGNRFDALDGLRTIAVGLVVLFHVSAPYMAAGFLGVDMFFVLSGFLITSGLIAQVERRGRIRLGDFWGRRIKRLMPAALLVVCVVLVWAGNFALVHRRDNLSLDAWYTIFYLANWRFIGSASYFENDGTVSPLLHMWSLAVEEQFYIFWPLLIAGFTWLVLRVLRAGNRNAVRVLAGVAVVIIAVSATLLAVLYVPRAAERAYMGTDAKAFEPMLGALLAILAASPRFAAWCTRCARFLFWGGAVSTATLFAVLDGPAPFYFQGGALLFSLGTGALILGVRHGLATPEAKVLAFAPISYLGRISYGLYLWHWPVAVWFGVNSGTFRPLRTVAVLALTLACSSASYHLVEMPIRQGRIGNFLKPWRAIVAGATAMVIMALSSSFVGGTPLARALHLGRGGGEVRRDVIMLVGDSVPLRLADPLAVAGQERGLTVVGTAQGMCTPTGAFLYFGPEDRFGKLCPPVKEAQDEAINTYSPGIILWWSRHEYIDRYEGDRVLSPESEEFWEVQRRDLIATADRLTKRGEILVVMLTERPGIGMLSRPENEQESMFVKYSVEHDEYRQRFNQIVTEVAAQRDDIRTVDGDSLFCGSAPSVGPGPLCDDTVNGHLMRPDGNHVDNDRFGPRVANQLLDETLAAAS